MFPCQFEGKFLCCRCSEIFITTTDSNIDVAMVHKILSIRSENLNVDMVTAGEFNR